MIYLEDVRGGKMPGEIPVVFHLPALSPVEKIIIIQIH
jgi:hypothetical protein